MSTPVVSTFLKVVTVVEGVVVVVVVEVVVVAKSYTVFIYP